MNYQKPKGTVDYYPQEEDLKDQIFEMFRLTSESFGFFKVETPAFEDLKLLFKKQGEEIKSQIFTLEKRGSEELGLRFDITVPCARLFIQKQKELPKPVKWYYCSRMWRYERPQAGRLREFYQMGVELFGSEDNMADIEVVNLLTEFFKKLGLSSKDIVIKINNRKLLQGLLESLGIDKKSESVIALIDKREKMDEKEFDKGLKDIGLNDECRSKLKDMLDQKDIKNLEDVKLSKAGKEGLKELKEVISNVDKNFVELDLSTARGLSYYTGTIFEAFDRKGKFRAIAGGGRYDNMIKQLGGEECAATGFGVGLSTISLLLKEKKVLQESRVKIDYYVILIGDEKVKKKGLKIISKLREKYKVDYDLMQRNVKKQMNYANSIDANNVIFIGEDEIKTENLSVKDMKTGKEKKVKVEEI